jgi:hypothetical protein
VPPPDNVHSRGCLDLEQYVSQAVPDRPPNWIAAADTWSDRVVNGQTGASGDPADYQTNLNVKFAIAPVPGNSGFPSVCGERVARPSSAPRPSGPPASGAPTPAPSPPGGGPGATPKPPGPPGDD